MGWLYMGVCAFDFVIAPILWSLTQSVFHGAVNVQWQPLTLQGAGLFHISMGAVLGLAAYGRTQEKLAGANNGGINLPAGVGTTYQPPSATQQPATGGFGAPAPVTNSFGSQPLASGSGFGSTPSAPTTSFAPAPSWGTTPVATTASGKKIVPDESQPVL